MENATTTALSLKEFEQKVRSLFISRNSIADTFDGMLLGFESKVPQDQLSILDILVEKCSSSPALLKEFREAGGFDKFLYFFLQSHNDETEDNPDLYLLAFQLLKILVFLDKSGFNGEAFKCYVDVFWKSSNLEIVLGALIYIRQLAETGHEIIENLLKGSQVEMKVAVKWLCIIDKQQLSQRQHADCESLSKEVGGRLSRPSECPSESSQSWRKRNSLIT